MKRKFIQKGDRLCPECLCDRQRIVVDEKHRYATSCGLLVYWRCKACQTNFVSRGENGKLQVASWGLR